MKQVLVCMQCVSKNIESKTSVEKESYFFSNLRDDGIYKISCTNSHTTYCVDQNSKFQNIFDLGCYAILDGYLREGVTSFAASLERFYEFGIKVLSKKHGISGDTFEPAWKIIKKQSERQLGAFVGLYTIEFKDAPQLLSNNEVNFRNDVVHNALIPEYEKALSFGQSVAEIQRRILKSLVNSCNEHVQGFFADEMKHKYTLIPKGEISSVFAKPSVVTTNLEGALDNPINLSESIKSIDKWRKWTMQLQA